MKTLYHFIAILILIPDALFGQTVNESFKTTSIDELYSIIKTVIIKENLNKEYGIEIIPQENCNGNEEDSIYLKTLLIKPESTDSLKNKNLSDDVVASIKTWPNKSILTLEDIDYIIKAKKRFEGLRWDNNQLGFNLKNKENFYAFSLPYFNVTHDKVILMYRHFCPGQCGTGNIILLKKNGMTWDITRLGMWIH